MRKFLTLLAILILVQTAFGDVRLVMVDGYCYLEGQDQHSETKVKFIKVSPSAITDSTCTDSSGYFFMSSLYEGIYDVEYTHAGFDTIRVEDQMLVGNTTLPPVTLELLPLSGALSGTLGPWTFNIGGEIWITAGDSLRILPGTTFIFDGPYPFQIYGTLLAEGTESDSIVFTTEQSGSNRWRGLRFDGAASSGSRLTYCVIEKGYATGDYPDYAGGGVSCFSSSPVIANCTINGNAAHQGGGVSCLSNSSCVFTNCVIEGNSAVWSGGVSCNDNSVPSFFINCTISNNSASAGGGGVELVDNSAMIFFTNCTIVGNSRGGYPGGGIDVARSTIGINSSIIAFSIGEGIHFENGGGQIEYCDIFGNSGGDIVGGGPPGIGQIVTNNANGDPSDVYHNIFLDPRFVNAVGDNFHLMDNSHCIGAGNPADTVSTDFEGDPRPNPPGSLSDIGADENPNARPPCELVGSQAGTRGPGVCHVIGDISIDAGDSLTLLPGTTLIFDGPYPFNIYGTLLAEGTESDSVVFTTEQSGENRWRGLRFMDSTSSGSHLAYCLIEKGYATGANPDFCGGGVFCNGSSPTFTACAIRDNTASGAGGGVDCRSSASPIFANCIINANSAQGVGGGVFCYCCSPSFMNCTISSNITADGRGGGIFFYACSPSLSGTIIAFSGGSGIHFEGSPESQIRYCGFFGNSGGNISYEQNNPTQGPPLIGHLFVTNANHDSCDIYENIFVDPMFVDTATGDFHLTDFSHCIGAADPADTVSTDFEGNPRPNPSWSFPDIGADEHWSGSPVLHLVVSMSSGNAVLHWTPFGAGPYYIYGATEPFTAGTLLETVSGATTWTDEETANRPSRYFYYVRAEWPVR